MAPTSGLLRAFITDVAEACLVLKCVKQALECLTALPIEPRLNRDSSSLQVRCRLACACLLSAYMPKLVSRTPALVFVLCAQALGL